MNIYEDLQHLKQERDHTGERKLQAQQNRDKAEKKIQPLPSEIFAQKGSPQGYKEPLWFFFLSLGLCFVLFLGINELVGISIRTTQSSQIPFLALDFIAAFLAALTTKKVMAIAAKNSHRQALNANNLQSQPIAWWFKLAKGDGALYLGLFFVTLETAFGLPGLLGLLPPNLAGNLLFVAAIVAGGAFFAVANVSLGYFVGIQEAVADARQREYEQELNHWQNSQEEQDICHQNEIYAEIVAESDAEVKYCQEKLGDLKREIRHLELQLLQAEERQETRNLVNSTNLGNGYQLPQPNSSHHLIDPAKF